MSKIERERAAMRRALDLAASPGVPLGPNPRVGCVLLSADGDSIAEGYHRGAGAPHAEADALAQAGPAARGATAVVTLEPCRHTGRTGPCTQALIDAGVARVVFAMSDPNPIAAGGAGVLDAAGVEVVSGLLADEAAALNHAWLFGLAHARPWVTWKFAATLDGRTAAADGSSRWISNAAARREVHALRRQVDTMLVGTGTVLADDPHLTARRDDGSLAESQPARVVMGQRSLSTGLRVFDDAAETIVLPTHDPAEALAELFARGRRHVLLEGGAVLAGAFLRAGLVDEVIAYVAPLLLGAGPSAVADLGISTLADGVRLRLEDVAVLGAADDATVRLNLTPLSSPHPEETP